MSFIGSPSAFDEPRQPTGSSAKAEPLALEKTLQGIRTGQGIMQSDLNSLNHKLKIGGPIHKSLEEIADILDNSAIARHSDSPLETQLKKIEKNTGTITPEQQLENKIADDKATKIEKKQSSLLEAINSNVIKGIKEGGIWKWFSDNWGKILVGAGVLALPYEWWDKLGGAWNTFMDMPWWGKLASALTIIAGWKIGGAALGQIGRNLMTKTPTPLVTTPQGTKGPSKVSPRQLPLFPPTVEPKTDGKLKKAWQATKKVLKVARWIPLVGVGGTILGYTAIAAAVVAAGSALKEGFLGEKDKETGKWSQSGKSFGEKIKESIGAFVEDISINMFSKESTKKFIDEMGDSLKDAAASFTKGIIKAYNTTEKWVKKTTKEITTKASQIIETVKKTPQLLKKGRKEALSSGGLPGGIGTHKGGDKDTYKVPGSKEESQYPDDVWFKAGPRWLGKKYDQMKSGFGKPAKPSGAVQHVAGTTTPTSAIKYSSIFNDKNEKPNMGKVAWNLLGGRGTVYNKILKAWNSFGGLPQPFFTSGFRDKDHPLSKKNPNSTHITGTAIDIKSKHLPEHMKGAVYAALANELINKGDFTWGHDHLAGFGDHFHFQKRIAPIRKAAKGLHGFVTEPTLILAGEAGREMVNITPNVSPDQISAGMNQLHEGSFGASSPTYNIINNTTTSVADGDTIVMPPSVHNLKTVN